MKTISKLTLAAGVAALGTTGGQAQSVGSACGCPDVSSRTTVNMSSLVDGSKNLLSNSTTLHCSNLYIMDTRVYVNDGQDLYIEPGTVIKANSNPGAAYSLIVSRGGQIWANGSESCPIILTAAADPLDGSYDVTNRGQWGGLLVLGRAYNNVRNNDANSGSVAPTGTDGVGLIEGLLLGDDRNYYGMPVGQEINDDNSGILRYVSVRYGGESIGQDNEINAFSFGSVGSGTTIDHIEAISNKDDGAEFFGGKARVKYFVSMHNDDDYCDWDEGFDGRIQFVYGLQGPDNTVGNTQGDNGFEMDSDDAPTNFADGGARSTPVIYNATIIARNLNDVGLEAKERTQGSIFNSIFARFDKGLNLTADCYTFWNAGTFNVKNCTFQECTTPLAVPGGATPADNTKFFTTDGNLSVGANALIDATYTMTQPGNVLTDRVNPVPPAGTATTTLTPPVDGFFCGAKYRGAFEPGAKPWTQNWTLAAQLGTDVSAVAGCTGDLNGDGQVNVNDYGLFINAFGNTCY
ncbi:MAG: hypothetical protein H6594_04560 [Flavobacteriales bacterium]|nr:hypothetical protein [Flavobacteriales bacterium]